MRHHQFAKGLGSYISPAAPPIDRHRGYRFGAFPVLNGFPRVRSTHCWPSAKSRSYLQPFRRPQLPIWIINPYPQCRETYYSTTVLRDALKYSILDDEHIHTHSTTYKASSSHLPPTSADSIRGGHCAISALQRNRRYLHARPVLITEDSLVLIAL